RLAVQIFERQDEQELALQRSRRSGHARRLDQTGGRGSKARRLELVDPVGEGCRRPGHRLGLLSGGEVEDELARLLRVPLAVLPAPAGEADDGRAVAEGVEEAVGRKVDPPTGIAAGDPADRPRGDDGLERVVRQPVPVLRLVEVNLAHACLPSPGPRSPIQPATPAAWGGESQCLRGPGVRRASQLRAVVDRILASDPAAYLQGATLDVDGGLTRTL